MTMLKSFPKTTIHFITDTYVTGSIKAAERERQIIHGPLTKIQKKWKAFLSNDTNKTDLTEFILREWEGDAYAHYLLDKFIFVVSGGS